MKSKNPELEKYKKEVIAKLEKLRPIFAHAAIGDFSTKVKLPDNDDDEFAELFTGIQIMTEVIQEKVSDIELVNNELKLAQTTAKLGNWEWDVGKNEIKWSDEMFRLFGISQENFEPSFAGYLSAIHPDDRKMVETTIQAAFKEKKPFSMYHKVLLPNNSIKIIHGIGRLVKDKKGKVVKMLGIAQDVTQEQRLQYILEARAQELEKANIFQSRLAAIVESSDDAIISKRLDGTITSWNNGAERIFGYKSEEAIGKNIRLIIPKRLLQEEEYLIGRIKKGLPVRHFQTVRVGKSGNEINLSVTVSPVRDGTGKVIGASKIARDITEQKKLEQQKDDFVAMVSHELKTPVTSLKVFTHILTQHLKQKTDSKGTEYIQRIDEQLDRLTKLVIDLLDITRVQRGKLEYQKSKFPIDALIKDVVKDLQQASSKHSIVIKGLAGKNVFADRDRIRQVLINLITNAVKYSPNAEKIIISFKKTAEMLTVAVQDFGIGIAEDQQEKIFNRFYQVSSPALKTYPGLGLGLYICNEIVINNGGKLWVESRLGKGSTFFFNLPIKK